MSSLARVAAIAAFAAAVVYSPSPASADELEDFQRARSAYDGAQYSLAIQRFEPLVLGAVPVLRTRALLLESRKYLGAAYLFLGRRTDAEAQFEALLRDDPAYQLDPVAFPSEVLDVFTTVHARLEREIQAAEAARLASEEAARRAAAERLLRERATMLRLVELAETETVEEQRSRWLAAIPFGVGQFQNGEDGWGLFFAISETSLLLAGGITYFLHEGLRDDTPAAADLREANLTARAFRIVNWSSIAGFGVLALAGVIHAQANFEPRRRTERRRPLPPELQEGLELGLDATPSSVLLQGRF